MTINAPHLQIDMISDVVCPWCIIGYKRLQQALTQFPNLNVSVKFQPFELNPQMSSEGQNINEHLAEKYGADISTIEKNRQQLREIAAREGVAFNFNDNSRIYNTFLAHKLLLAAEAKNCQKELKLALFNAYFNEQKNISEPTVLLEIAIQNGFTSEDAQSVLSDEALSKQVREKESTYSHMGISAVPTFVFNNQYAVSGAQEVEVLSNVIQDTMNRK